MAILVIQTCRSFSNSSSLLILKEPCYIIIDNETKNSYKYRIVKSKDDVIIIIIEKKY